MSRFAVFSGQSYYPSGGWDDFDRRFADPGEAQSWIAEQEEADWAQIVDLEAFRVVERWYRVDEFREDVRQGRRWMEAGELKKARSA